MAPEAWWPRAVFYRIAPARFQDSDGDGKGDLHGVVERLDYLQSLGVDALILDMGADAPGTLGAGDAGDPDSPSDLGDLVRDASQRHLRVLLTVTPGLLAGPRPALLSAVHDWLAAGAAGVWMPRPPTTSEAGFAAALADVRPVLHSFPGDRLLLTDTAAALVGPAAAPSRPRRRTAGPSEEAGAVLLTSAVFPVHAGSPEQLRQSLASAAEDIGVNAHPLLRFAGDPPAGTPDAAADAALLLASRGAVILDFGVEIGLDTFPGSSTVGTVQAGATLPVMQWTPSNRSPVDASAAQGGASAAPAEPVYGSFHPYQPPPKGLTAGMQSNVHVAEDANIPPAPPDPDTMVGFSSAASAGAPIPDSKERNVIVEDRNPHSLLNQYRQLIALHHDNATLRNGGSDVLPQPLPGTLLWVRRAPAGSRTVANILAAVNLSASPVSLNLDGDLTAQGMRPGALRTLFSSLPTATTGETTSRLTLPAHAALLAEIFHGGVIEPGSGRRERGSRRHSGRRVRR